MGKGTKSERERGENIYHKISDGRLTERAARVAAVFIRPGQANWLKGFIKNTFRA